MKLHHTAPVCVIKLHHTAHVCVPKLHHTAHSEVHNFYTHHHPKLLHTAQQIITHSTASDEFTLTHSALSGRPDYEVVDDRSSLILEAVRLRYHSLHPIRDTADSTAITCVFTGIKSVTD